MGPLGPSPVPSGGWYPGAPLTIERAAAEGRILVAPRWGLGDALAGLGAALLLAVLAAVLVLSVGQSWPPGQQLVVASTLPWLALGGWPVLVTRLRGNGPRLDLGVSLGWAGLGWGVLGGATAIVLGLAATLLTTAVAGDFTSAAGDAALEIAGSGDRGWLILFAILVALGAPIVEELAFRGLLFASLARRGLAPWASVAWSTLAFALFHFEPVRLLVLLVIGAVLGVVRWRSRSVGAAMVAHALNNIPGAVGLLLLP